MRAAVLSSPRAAAADPLELVELAEPVPRADEVVIGVEACGVCRTDLQLCEGDLELRKRPVVPGHQVVGVIESKGHRVRNVDVGQRVGLAWIASACGKCRFCTAERENLCDSVAFTGWDRDGGFSELIVARGEFVFPLPEALDPVAVAPLLCGGAIGLRSLRLSGIRPGGRLGLFGFGASATCAIEIARHWSCEICVFTRSSGERQRAAALGAVWTGTYADRSPEPLDAAVTFAPSGDVVVAALKNLDKGGVVAINAIHLDRIPEFEYRHLWWERQLRSVANVTRDDVAALLDLAVSIPITTSFDVFGLEDVNAALRAISSGDVTGAAVIDMRAHTGRSHPRSPSA
jgi:propanol-preferring alcohol dehydrogenase